MVVLTSAGLALSDVAFAATGDVTASTIAYEGQFRTAGHTVINEESGSTPVTAPPGSTGGPTSTTVTVDGSTFTAKEAR
jgi:hypothetical protein